MRGEKFKRPLTRHNPTRTTTMMRSALAPLGLHKRRASSMMIVGGPQEAESTEPSASSAAFTTSNNLVNPYSRSDQESCLPVPSAAPSSSRDAENWQPDGEYFSQAASDLGTPHQWHRNSNVRSVSTRVNGDKHFIKGCKSCQG